MKRVILIAAAGAVLATLAACNSTILGTANDSKPEITRIFAAPDCGVAPMQVEFYGIASGGNESGDATGGNNNLEFTWSFGDGTTSNTSIAYHTYRTPGEYTATLRVEDPDGESATRTVPVIIVADSLDVSASVLNGPVFSFGDTVQFDYRAGTCGVDAMSDADRASYLVQRWIMHDPGFANGGVYTGAMPQHTFSAAGTYDVEVVVTYVGWAVTRRDTVQVVVN